MKLIYSIFLLLAHLTSLGQTTSTKDSLAKYKITRESTVAIEYENDQQIKKKYTETIYDEFGHWISSVYYDENKKITSFALCHISKDRSIEKIEQYNKDSTLSSTSINIEDAIRKRNNHYVIRNGDTLIEEIMYYDQYGFDSIIFSKFGKNGKFIVSGEWNYDKSGKLLDDKFSTQTYTPDKSKYVEDTINNCITKYISSKKISKTCTNKNEIIEYLYVEGTTGYAYGIAFKHFAGGRCIRRYNNIGLETEIINEDKKGKLLAHVTIEYK